MENNRKQSAHFFFFWNLLYFTGYSSFVFVATFNTIGIIYWNLCQLVLIGINMVSGMLWFSNNTDQFYSVLYTTQNLLRITFSFNDLMLKTNRLKKDFFYKDRLIFGLDDAVANMSIRHVYYAWGAREKTYPLKRVSFCLVSSSALVHLANFQLSYHKF